MDDAGYGGVPTAAPALAEALRRRGLWLDAPSHARELRRRGELGERLFAAPAAPGLPSWKAMAFSAGYSKRARASIAPNLAFGYQMAILLGPSLPPGPSESGAVIAGCFNIAATFVDRVCDNPRLGRPALLAVLDEATLDALIDNPAFLPRFLRPYEATDSPNVRLLLLSMFAFFTTLQPLVHRSGPKHRAALTDMVRAAYRAQLSTTEDLAGDPDDAARARQAHAKAAMILRIIAQLACLDPEPSREAADAPDPDGAAAAVGRLFSLLDDLCDLDTDARTGEANALLLRASGDGLPPAFYVQPAIEEVCAILDAAGAGPRPAFGDRRDTLLSWVRSWIESDRPEPAG